MPTLAEMRKSKFLTQEELAKEAGVSKGTITNIELGRPPQLRTARAIAKALGVGPERIDWPEIASSTKVPKK